MSNFEDGAEFAGDFLEHWGVKGMRWGRRKDKGGSADGPPAKRDDDSEDFSRTADIAVRAKSNGIRTLSNKELRDLVDRINLEQNFAKVNTPEAKKTSPMKTGINYVSGKVKKIGDMTVDSIMKTAVQVNVEQYKNHMKITPKAAA